MTWKPGLVSVDVRVVAERQQSLPPVYQDPTERTGFRRGLLNRNKSRETDVDEGVVVVGVKRRHGNNHQTCLGLVDDKWSVVLSVVSGKSK